MVQKATKRNSPQKGEFVFFTVLVLIYNLLLYQPFAKAALLIS